MYSKFSVSEGLGSEVPEFSKDQQPVGRTGADLLYLSRFAILVAILVIGFLILLWFSGDAASEILSEYGDAIAVFVMAFIFMFIVARGIVLRLLRVPTIDYLVLDFQDMTGSIHRIPVSLLKDMEVSGGNNLQFTWRDGHSFRLARSVDLDAGSIVTAWPHEIPIEQAAFTLGDLQRREEDYKNCKLENLLLRRCPVVIASDLARESNLYLTKEISEVLGLGELDVAEYLKGLDPLDPKDSGDQFSEEEFWEFDEFPEDF